MFAQQTTLARRCPGEYVRIELEIRKGDEALRDPAIGVVDLQQVAHLLGAVGSAAIPFYCLGSIYRLIKIAAISAGATYIACAN